MPMEQVETTVAERDELYRVNEFLRQQIEASIPATEEVTRLKKELETQAVMATQAQMEMLEQFKQDLDRVRSRELELSFAVERIRAESEAIQSELQHRKAAMEELESSKTALSKKTVDLESTVHRLQYEIEEEKSRAEIAISEATSVSRSREDLRQQKRALEDDFNAAVQDNDDLRGRLAQASEEHRREITEMQNTFQQLMDESAAQLIIVRQLQTELAGLGEKYEKTCGDLRAALAEKEACTARIAELQAELDAARERLTQSHDSMREESDILRSQVDALRQEVELLTKDRDQLAKELQSATTIAQQSQEEIERQNQILADLGAAMESKDERIEELSSSVSELEGYISGKDAEIRDLDEKLTNVVSEADRLHEDLADKAEKIGSLTQNFGELNWTVESVKTELEERCGQILRFSMELEELARQNCVLKEMVENLTTEKTSLIMENHSIHYDFKQLAEENEAAKKELDTLRKVNASHQELTGEAQDLRQKLDETMMENTTWKQCLEQMKGEKQELLGTTDELRKAKVDLSVKNVELQGRVDRMSQEVEQLKNKAMYLSSASDDLTKLSSDFDQVLAERNQLKEEMEIFKAQCEDLGCATRSLIDERNQLSGELQELTKDVNNKEAIIGSLQEQYNQVYAQVKALRECVVQLEQERSELSRMVDSLEQEKSELTSKMAYIEAQAERNSVEMESLREKAMGLDAQSCQFQELDKVRSVLEEENSSLKLELDQLRSEKTHLQNKIEGLTIANSSLEEKSRSLEDRIKDSCSEMENFQRRADAMTARAEAYELLGEMDNGSSAVDKLKAEKERLEETVKELTAAKVSLMKEKDVLVSENAAMKKEGDTSATLMNKLLVKLDELGSRVGESSGLKTQLRIVLNCAKEATVSGPDAAQAFDKSLLLEDNNNLKKEIEVAKGIHQELKHRIDLLEDRSQKIADKEGAAVQELQEELSSARASLAEKEEHLKALNAKMESTTKAVADAESDREHLKVELQNLFQTLKGLQQERDSLATELLITQEKNLMANEDQEYSNAHVFELTKELNELHEKYTDAAKEVERSSSDSSGQNALLQKLNRDVSEYKYMLSIAERECQDKDKELAERDREISTLRTSMDELKNDISSMRNAMMDSSNVSGHLVERLKTLEEDNSKLSERLAQAQEQNKILAEKEAAAASSQLNLMKDLSKSMETLQDKDGEIIRLNNAVAKLELEAIEKRMDYDRLLEEKNEAVRLLQAAKGASPVEAPIIEEICMKVDAAPRFTGAQHGDGMWTSVLSEKEKHVEELLSKLDEKQKTLEAFATKAITLGQSEELLVLRDHLGQVVEQRDALKTTLGSARGELENLRQKYSEEIGQLTDEIQTTKDAIDKKESDLSFLRSELDRVLLECQRWKAYAKERPLELSDCDDLSKDEIIANLKTELEIVNEVKRGLVFKLERKVSMEKLCDNLTRDNEEQRIMLSNLQAELDIVNKTKTILACQRSVDDRLENGFEHMKMEVDNLDAELQLVKRAKDMLEGQLAQLRDEHDYLKQETVNKEAEFSESIRQLTSDCAEKIAEISLLTDNLERVMKDKEDLETELKVTKFEHSSLEAKLNSTTSALDAKTAQYEVQFSQKEARIQELEAQLDVVTQEKEVILKDLQRANAEVCQLRADCDTKTSELYILKNSAEGAHQEVAMVKENLIKLDQEVFSTQSESDSLKLERESLRHTVEEQVKAANAKVQETLEQCKVLKTQNESYSAVLKAKEVDAEFLKDQLASKPLMQALEGTKDEFLAALRREMERRNNYIEELTGTVVKLEQCNNELSESFSKQSNILVPSKGLEADVTFESLHTELQHKDLELSLARHEYEQIIKETEEKYENTLSALQQQVDSAQCYQETAEKLRSQLDQQEREFNEKLEMLQRNVANGHHGDGAALGILHEAANLEISQLKRQIEDCRNSCDDRVSSMAREYEMKLESFVQQLNDNLVEQEKDLGDRFDVEYEERARMDRAAMETKHKEEIKALNAEWEDRFQTMREEMLRQHHAELHLNNSSTNAETSQIRILQSRVQELQDALTNTKPTSERDFDGEEDPYQGRVQELIGKLGEMEADKNRLKRKIDELNKLHNQEIQSYTQTIQSCFKEGDLQNKFEHIRKMQRQELANTQIKLRTEYEAKFVELKNRFEEKLREIKESMLRHGPLERELLSRSRSPAFGSRPISPGVLGFEVNSQINQLIADFIVDIRSVEGVPDNLMDKLAALKRRAEVVSTHVTRETQAAVEREKLKAQEVQDEMEEKIAELQTKQKLELARLADDYNAHKKEMEFASQAALAAVHSGTTSLDVLKQQLMDKHKEIHLLRKKHKSEMKQMKKLLELQRAKTPNREEVEEEVVKMEYLRDILYQYMTGKNSATLARMISAVVNFSQDQTKQILQHECKRMDSRGRTKADYIAVRNKLC